MSQLSMQEGRGTAITLDQFYNQMNKTYRQVYKEEQDLENNLASVWGYNLHSTALDHKSKKQKEKPPPSVASITLRKFGKEIPKTERIRQVEQSIKALHNQRKLMEQQDKAMKAAANGQVSDNSKNKLIQWMENLIDDYNSIVEHKHITSPTVVKGEKGKLTPSQSQELTRNVLAKIDQKKKQLENADMKTQIKINREIANLYRQFYDYDRRKISSVIQGPRTVMGSFEPTQYNPAKNMKSDESVTGTHPGHHMFLSVKYPHTSSDRHLIEERKRKSSITPRGDKMSQMLKRYKQSEYKKQYTKNSRAEPPSSQNSRDLRARSQLKMDRNKLQKDFLAPYGNKNDINTYRQIEHKIRSNYDALDIWKSKVQQVTRSARQTIKRTPSPVSRHPPQPLLQQSVLPKEQQFYSRINQDVDLIDLQEQDTRFNGQYKAAIKQHEQQKEDIMSELLRKRNNKFNKLWGTRILVKFDAKKEAKLMLRGEPERNANNKSVLEKSARTPSRQKSRTPREKNLPAQNRANLSLWLEQANDQVHYARTCKNEKINLLFKRH